MLPQTARQWLKQNEAGEIVHCTPVSGGSICQSYHVITSSGESYFIKTKVRPNPSLFESEALGLEALGKADIIRTPAVRGVHQNFLILEYIPLERRSERFWQLLGQQLAGLHQVHSECYGLEHDNYCGSTPQPNSPCEDGYFFFAEYRLNYQANLAAQKGWLKLREVEQIEALGYRLPQLIPKQPPSLLHGDLWSGNIMCTKGQTPVLVDPATYYGWPESELAMTLLFGGFDAQFYRAYEEHSGIDKQWRERASLYNLYHLLNHLNIFGKSYYRDVMAVVDRFS